MHPKNILTLWCLLLSGCCALLSAQSEPLVISAPDVSKLLGEDAGAEHTRFAAPVVLDLVAPVNGEDYRYADGNWWWSQTVTVGNATALGLLIDSLHLPAGASLQLSNGADVRGPFAQSDASRAGRLHTDFLPGSTVTLTYRGPLPETAPFRLRRVDHVYRPDRWTDPFAKGFEDSNDCHVNANCPAGDGWDDQKASTGRINLVVAEGVGFCSGNLINNTAQDGRPLLLTGFHCMDGFTPLYDLWSIDLDYRGNGCDDPAQEPDFQRYTGVAFRAGWQQTDFMLLEITDPTFVAEEHFFAGWDRSDGNVTGEVTAFHHPIGDVQKIGRSAATGMPILSGNITWNSGVVTPPRHHFRMIFALGTFEQGSSGSAFFDDQRRIRGTLNGGNANCPGGNSEAFVGRFHLSWAGGGADTSALASWLDPLGTAPVTLDGATLRTKRFLSGRVFRGNGPAVGARIKFEWLPLDSVVFVTDANGFFRGERPPNVTAYQISGSFEEDGPLELGVDVLDIINIRRDILAQDTLAPTRRLAADVNGSGGVRVSDITRIVRVLLGIGDWQGRPNWLVVPVGYPLDPLPSRPQDPIPIQISDRSRHDIAVSFFVLKTGDTDGSAE